MIGQVVGNFKVLSEVGEGGMGKVYRALDMMLEREVALKVLRPEFARVPDIVERFRSEAVALAKLLHPNIAGVYSFARFGDDLFMAMEFVRGSTLERILAESGAVDWQKAVPLLCQALDGIEHAHRLGIIHRDIKPANVMLTHDGVVKVTDFGIARVLGRARQTQEGRMIGTIEYMSPERIRGLEVDARSDIYSLGIVLYEMLTGTVPFASDSEYEVMRAQIEDQPRAPRELIPAIPEQVQRALLTAVAKNPGERFASAIEMKNALRAGIEEATRIVAVPIAPAREAPPPVPPPVVLAPAPKTPPPAPSPPPAPQAAPAPAAPQAPKAAPAPAPAPPRVAPQPLPVAAAPVRPAPVQTRVAEVPYVPYEPPAPEPEPRNWRPYMIAAALVVVALVAILMWPDGSGSEVPPQAVTPARSAPAVQAPPPRAPEPETAAIPIPPRRTIIPKKGPVKGKVSSDLERSIDEILAPTPNPPK